MAKTEDDNIEVVYEPGAIRKRGRPKKINQDDRHEEVIRKLKEAERIRKLREEQLNANKEEEQPEDEPEQTEDEQSEDEPEEEQPEEEPEDDDDEPPRYVTKDIKPPRFVRGVTPEITDRTSKIKPINYRKSSFMSWFSIGGIKKRWNLSMNIEKCYLINMELRNGMHSTFIVKERENTFAYNGKKYTFDDDLKYLHVDTQLYALDYHEDFTMPIRRKIDVNEINRAISGSGITEIEYMTNPSTLERFTVSKIAEGIMKGQQLDEFFRQIRLIVIIGTLVGILHLILFVAKTGMLKQINIPGLGG